MTSEVPPSLLRDGDVGVTDLRPSWLWVPGISTVVFHSTFHMAKRREGFLPPVQSCIHLGSTTEFGTHVTAVKFTAVLLQPHWVLAELSTQKQSDCSG